MSKNPVDCITKKIQDSALQIINSHTKIQISNSSLEIEDIKSHYLDYSQSLQLQSGPTLGTKPKS